LKYKVIAVDFDGTIVKENYPEIGELIPAAKRTLKRFKEKGGYIIVWTCRSSEALREAEEFLNEWNVPYDTINENIPCMIERYKTDPRKVGADLYIDDRNPGGVDWNYIAKLLGVD
jgi:predicted mannosyl-3-phosphoglycerate phosphatase (HAD superfamily)